jgi:hypothetical protein
VSPLVGVLLAWSGALKTAGHLADSERITRDDRPHRWNGTHFANYLVADALKKKRGRFLEGERTRSSTGAWETIMHVQILVGAGLVLLLILCLPIASIQKLVLEVYALALRLALLALVGPGRSCGFTPNVSPPR